MRCTPGPKILDISSVEQPRQIAWYTLRSATPTATWLVGFGSLGRPNLRWQGFSLHMRACFVYLQVRCVTIRRGSYPVGFGRTRYIPTVTKPNKLSVPLMRANEGGRLVCVSSKQDVLNAPMILITTLSISRLHSNACPQQSRIGQKSAQRTCL